MSLWWSAALVAAGATGAAWLAGWARSAWRAERDAQAYELTPSYGTVAVRAALAGAAALAVLGGGVGLVLTQSPTGADLTAATARLDGRPADVRAPGPRPAPGTTAAHAHGHGAGDAATAAPVAALTQVGTAAGGRVFHGTLPGVPGAVTVWLPASYPGRTFRLQTLLVRAPQDELPQVWDGLADAVDAGQSNSFIAVAPDAPCALALATPDPATLDPAPASPSPSPSSSPAPAPADDTALRRALAARFTVDPHPRAWAELGIDAGAACAVSAELAAPQRLSGTAALSGRFPAGLGRDAAPGVRLFLGDARRDTAGQADAERLRAELAGTPDASARLSAVVRDLTPELERTRLVRLAADYLTEEFAETKAQTRTAVG